MSVLRSAITIRTTDGVVTVPDAAMIGALAVHRSWPVGDIWTITHLPTGRLLATGFRTERAAILAMRKVAAIRDWRKLSSGACTVELGEAVERVVKKYTSAWVGFGRDRDKPFGRGLNRKALGLSPDSPDGGGR